jgi:general secretion pathway protein G
MYLRGQKKNGFSLVELVIVIVILGIIAAIAIPRISSGSKNAGEASLRANLATIRNAIDWYYGQHNTTFPGVNAAGGTYGAAGTSDAFTNQLTKYTKTDGTVSPDKDAAFPFGSYVRGKFPALPVGSNAGKSGVKIVAKVGPLAGTDGDAANGWIFNPTTGEFIANLPDTEKGADNVAYTSY